jgi:hypothetical protein
MLIESAIKKGHLCASDMKFNPTTVDNYMALFATKGGISLTDKSIAKNNASWTAEHSSIGMMALIIVVASTHFYVVADEDIEWRQFLSSLPEDSKLLYKYGVQLSWWQAGSCKEASSHYKSRGLIFDKTVS